MHCEKNDEGPPFPVLAEPSWRVADPSSGHGHLEDTGAAVYSFQAQASHFYRFNCTNPLRWTIELFALSGQRVATGQDNSMGALELFHKPDADGTYKLVVTHPGGAAADYDQLFRSLLDVQGESLATVVRIALVTRRRVGSRPPWIWTASSGGARPGASTG